MSPLAVLTAIIFGSATAISFGLITTTIVFLVLGTERQELGHELWPLVRSCLWFIGLTAVAGACLYATLKEIKWRMPSQAAMWLFVAVVAYAYWPK